MRLAEENIFYRISLCASPARRAIFALGERYLLPYQKRWHNFHKEMCAVRKFRVAKSWGLTSRVAEKVSRKVAKAQRRREGK
jgi:phage FluMu gp28-like protein